MFSWLWKLLIGNPAYIPNEEDDARRKLYRDKKIEQPVKVVQKPYLAYSAPKPTPVPVKELPVGNDSGGGMEFLAGLAIGSMISSPDIPIISDEPDTISIPDMAESSGDFGGAGASGSWGGNND